MVVPTTELRKLFAQSGGRCAYTGCNLTLAADGSSGDRAVEVAEIAHIVAGRPAGPRANPSLPQRELDRYENLILLCHAHHAIVDAEPEIYTVERLLAMKTEHEKRVSQAINTALNVGDLAAVSSPETQRDFESVVIFVHGLFSSSQTWTPLRDLLLSDADFGGVALLPFDYPTPKFKLNPLKVIPDIDALAKNLKSFIQRAAEQYRDVVIVSHSQGGLLVQRYLAQLLNGGQAAELQRIRRVILLACPNSGSELFLAYRRAIFLWRHPQERQLRPFNAQVQQSRSVVINRAIHAREKTSSTHPLSVVVYAGLEDGIVKKESALDVFPDDSTRVIKGDHFTIIEPSGHRDPNYVTLKHDLLEGRPRKKIPEVRKAVVPVGLDTLRAWGWKDEAPTTVRST